MTNQEYHDNPAVSRSGVIKLLRSPAHYKTKTETTRAMEIGTAVHSKILEGRTDYVVNPFDSFRSKEAREWREAQTEIVLNETEAAQIEAMETAVNNHRGAMKLLSEGVPEQTYFFTEPHTGVKCKVRPDWITPDGFLVDLKTTNDASESGFKKSVYSFRYDIQTAFYLDGVEYATGQRPKGFIFINVEKSEPFGVSLFQLNDDWIESARFTYIDALDTFKTCEASNEWPAYSEQIQTLLK